MAKRPKFTSREVTRHGKPIWYFRRDGRRIRLPDQFGTDEWWQAYDAALYGKAQPYRNSQGGNQGDFFRLVHSYLDSRAFNDLAKNTRMQRSRLLRDAADKAGNASPEQVDQISIRQAMQSRPAFSANNFLKALRGFYKWAIEMGHVEQDPTQGVAMNRPKTEGWKIWTPQLRKQFVDYWAGVNKGEEPRLKVKALDVLDCFHLALETGLRRGDLARLSLAHFKGSHFEITAEKTGVTCFIPVQKTGEFLASGMPDDRPFLSSELGTPFTSETLGNWFRDACKAAGIPDGMRLHSLRKTAATLDAENGWSANELMAKYGWLDIREAELYTRQADRKNLAIGAGKR
jgi:integrase